MKAMKLHLMKKALLVLGMMTLANLVKGQEIVTDFWHENGQYLSGYGLDIVETSDKCMIVETWTNPLDTLETAGLIFYKFSTDGIVRDSLFIEYDGLDSILMGYDGPVYTSSSCLFERDPEHLDHFVYAYFLTFNDTLYFRMRTIDMYLNIIGDTLIEIDHSTEFFDNAYSQDFFVEPNGDIIASYSIKDDPNETFMTYFLRIGFDGTLKSRTEVPQIRYFDNLEQTHTGMYNESPIQYCYWGSNFDSNYGSNPCILLYVLDSLFNVVEEKPFNFYQYCTYTANGWNDCFVPVDDQHYLQINTYNRLDPNTYHTISWILLEKRNRQHVRQAVALIGETLHYPATIGAIAVDANTIYLSYMTAVAALNHLVLLRLDGDLNIQWERHFLSEDTFHYAISMKVLDDGSIAISSFDYFSCPNSISVVVIKDNYDNLEEMGIHVRPYDFYPNPTQSELHLRYSPDVTPKQIELYDLQGRLMLMQRTGLDNINMKSLAAGQYVMKVTMKDGKNFTDMVVKE
jgi:hypothetical protein